MKRTKQGQPLTVIGRAKLRKLRNRGRARDWHKSRRVMREQLEARRRNVATWFGAQIGKVLGEVFSPENMRRAVGPMATVGEPRIQFRGIDFGKEPSFGVVNGVRVP